MISMQINSEVDKIVNKVTQQDRIRFNEITRYPLCILYKEFSENIEQMLEAELITKFGNERAVILSKAGNGRMAKGGRLETFRTFAFARFRTRFHARMELGV